MLIKGCPRWEHLYNSLKKEAIDGSNKRVIDIEDDESGQSSSARVVRPRGKKATKQDIKHEVAALALEEKLKGLIASKEESTAKRYVEKRKDKEEAMAYYVEMQKKKLEIEENRIKAEDNRIKLAMMTEENQIKAKENQVKLAMMAEENRIMMTDLSSRDPEQKAWILRKQKMIHEHDA